MKAKFSLDKDLISLYYNKFEEYKKLKTEVEKIRDTIKEDMIKNEIAYHRLGAYTLELKPFHKVSDSFIQIMELNGYSELISKQCAMKDFKKICTDLNIENESEYLYCYCKSLYIYKK